MSTRFLSLVVSMEMDLIMMEIPMECRNRTSPCGLDPVSLVSTGSTQTVWQRSSRHKEDRIGATMALPQPLIDRSINRLIDQVDWLEVESTPGVLFYCVDCKVEIRFSHGQLVPGLFRPEAGKLCTIRDIQCVLTMFKCQARGPIRQGNIGFRSKPNPRFEPTGIQ